MTKCLVKKKVGDHEDVNFQVSGELGEGGNILFDDEAGEIALQFLYLHSTKNIRVSLLSEPDHLEVYYDGRAYAGIIGIREFILRTEQQYRRRGCRQPRESATAFVVHRPAVMALRRRCLQE